MQPHPSAARRASQLSRELGALLLLTIIAALPFLQVAGFAFLNYDDPLHVQGEPMVLEGLTPEGISWALQATPSNLWHPLTWISYMAEVSLFGGGADQPGVHHLGNLALHLVATGFLFLILRTLGISLSAALLAALLFALHPLHVEPVAWISSRKEVLSSALAICAVFAHARQRLAVGDGARHAWRLLTWTTLVAALASKPSAAVIPALFVIVDAFMDDGRRLPRNLVTFLGTSALRLWPCFLLAAATAAIAVAVQASGSHQETMADSSLAGRLSESPMQLGFYTWRTLVPRNLVFEYPAPVGMASRLALGCLGAALVVAIPCLWSRGTRMSRKLSLSVLWYIACLAPVLGLVYVGTSFTTDRYTYLALAGPCLALATILDAIPARHRTGRVVALVACLLLVTGAALQSRTQAATWRDDASLFGYTVATSPRSPTAQINLATLYRMQKDSERARHHYQVALELSPGNGVASYNLAQIFLNGGNRTGAVAMARDALGEIRLRARAHYFLGVVLGNPEHPETFQPEEAHQHLSRAHAGDPANPRYGHDFARSLIGRGRNQQAIAIINHCRDNLPPSSPWASKLKALLSAAQP